MGNRWSRGRAGLPHSLLPGGRPLTFRALSISQCRRSRTRWCRRSWARSRWRAARRRASTGRSTCAPVPAFHFFFAFSFLARPFFLPARLLLLCAHAWFGCLEGLLPGPGPGARPGARAPGQGLWLRVPVWGGCFAVVGCMRGSRGTRSRAEGRRACHGHAPAPGPAHLPQCPSLATLLARRSRC